MQCGKSTFLYEDVIMTWLIIFLEVSISNEYFILSTYVKCENPKRRSKTAIARVCMSASSENVPKSELCEWTTELYGYKSTY